MLAGRTTTLFYPLTPDPDDPDLLGVGSPLSDERLMTENGRVLGVLAQDCKPTRDPDRCTARVTLVVSSDAPAGAEPARFEPVDLVATVVAEEHCPPVTLRALAVERSRCPGAERGGSSSCAVAPAQGGGYR